MPYLKIQPCEILRPFIESLWVQEDLRDAAVEFFRPTKVLPNASIEAAFYYLDPFAEITEGQRQVVAEATITGQKTRNKEYVATGRTGVIIVRFTPWGASAFFDLPLSELLDRNVDLKLIADPNNVDILRERLEQAPGALERVDLVQYFFLNLLKPENVDPLVAESVRRISCLAGIVSIKQLASTLKISKRQFERRFAYVVGMSPKRFSNILRFQNALSLKRRGFIWSEIAESCQYFDQAHYIKEFKAFAGLSPEKLFTSWPATPLARHFNRDTDLSPFYNTIYI